MFNVDRFIIESNKIDPQFNSAGTLIPGSKTGEPMYDNQFRAVELIPDLISINPTPSYLALALHRELTRGIDYFENRGQSGQYRKCNVYIGGEQAPIPALAQEIVETVLIPKIEEVRGKNFNSECALRFAWWCHDLFECAHPFIDGNGRTGRLLLNTVLEMLGHEKVIVNYSDRFLYYKKNQEFRETEFSNIYQMLRIRKEIL